MSEPTDIELADAFDLWAAERERDGETEAFLTELLRIGARRLREIDAEGNKNG